MAPIPGRKPYIVRTVSSLNLSRDDYVSYFMKVYQPKVIELLYCTLYGRLFILCYMYFTLYPGPAYKTIKLTMKNMRET